MATSLRVAPRRTDVLEQALTYLRAVPRQQRFRVTLADLRANITVKHPTLSVEQVLANAVQAGEIAVLPGALPGPAGPSSLCYLPLSAKKVLHCRAVKPPSKRGLGSASLHPTEQKRPRGTTDHTTTRGSRHPDNVLAENVPAKFFKGGVRPTLSGETPHGDACYTECELPRGKGQEFKKNQVQVKHNGHKKNYTVGFFKLDSGGGQVACRFLSAKPH
jgi:hypothetical protein